MKSQEEQNRQERKSARPHLRSHLLGAEEFETRLDKKELRMD
jgi:hypothetical protein